MKKGHLKISHKRFIDAVTAPGIVNLLTGKRGQGKTATFVSMIQPAVAGEIENYDQKIEVITNIVFAKGGTMGRNMPPGVHYAESVEQMFRIILKIYDESGNAVRIAVGMDEAQQHMLADQNGDPVNQAMLSFLAVVRKFNVSLWFMSPIRTNLVPKIRQFIDDPVKPGNLDFFWFKDLPRIKRFIRTNGLDTKPYQYTVWQTGTDQSRGRILYVPKTSWLTKVSELKRGEYGYDDEAVATFRYGDHPDFDHQVLLDLCSGHRKHDLPEQIREYFSMLDAGEFSNKGRGHDADRQIVRLKKAREMKLTWDTIEALEGVNKSTLRTRLKKHSPPAERASSNNGGGGTCDGGTT